MAREIEELRRERRQLRRAVMAARRFAVHRAVDGRPVAWALNRDRAEKLDRQLARALGVKK